MKVLITGANGFIAKNLIATLINMPNIEILRITKKDSEEKLKDYVLQSDFIFHLAGINRPNETYEFYEGNSNLTKTIVNTLQTKSKTTPLLLTSSIHAENSNNDYAKSKRAAEEFVIDYTQNTGAPVFIYRLPNVFGKWSRPNYNSVIATWCYNIARDKEIQIDDKNKVLNLVYIDDVVASFIDKLYINPTSNDIYYKIDNVYEKTLGEIAELLYSFKQSRETLLIPHISKGFTRALYATYLSFLPTNQFSYKLKGHQDERGTFYEILKTLDSGQLGLSTTKPGITRGNHYHNTKNEKFLVVKGKALIELRDIFSDKVIKYEVSSNNMEIVEMIPGYTHNIKNIGDEELILLIWANENYDPQNPDTYYLEVEK